MNHPITWGPALAALWLVAGAGLAPADECGGEPGCSQGSSQPACAHRFPAVPKLKFSRTSPRPCLAPCGYVNSGFHRTSWTSWPQGHVAAPGITFLGPPVAPTPPVAAPPTPADKTLPTPKEVGKAGARSSDYGIAPVRFGPILHH